jgi:hypothetical protein
VFRVDRSSVAGALTLTSDVVPTTTLPNIATDSDAQPITDLYLGISNSPGNILNAQPAMDMWMDDVILHHAPVTCAD